MTHNQLFIEGSSKNALINELEKILDRLFIYTGDENNIDFSEYFAILIDFEDIVTHRNEFILNEIINKALIMGKVLVLLNVHNGKYLSKMIGIGFESKCMIIKSYENYNVFYPLDLNEKETQDYGESHVTQTSEGTRSFNIEKESNDEVLNYELHSYFERLSVTKQARIIENIIYSDTDIYRDLSFQSNVNTLAVLPKNQYKVNYLVLKSKWNLSEQQITNNSVVMELSLIASYNPNYKYLKIRSAKSSFSPSSGGEIENYSSYHRGFFQTNIKIHMQPNTDKFKKLSTEPKDTYKQSQFTTNCNFSVGVDTLKNPTFRQSYNIIESKTMSLSDFNIYNNGTGNAAEWDFKLSMIENSIWDLFDEQFMKKSKIKQLPKRATKKLNIITEAVWYAENNLNETVGVQLYWKVDYHHCDVTGTWEEYAQCYEHRCRALGYEEVPVYVDFSAVYA